MEETRSHILEKTKPISQSEIGIYGGSDNQITSYEAKQKWSTYRLIAITLMFFGLLEGLIWLRVILKLMAANPANSFVRFVYQASSIIIYPFANLVDNPTGGGMVVEITSIIGMITYCLICWTILQWVQKRRKALDSLVSQRTRPSSIPIPPV